MRKLSSLILFMALSVSLFSQSSPHGDDFKVSCTDCHNTEGWKIDLKTLTFKHSTTKFPLVGQHQSLDCRLCHKVLEFSKAETECISCHTDMHNQTVGPDCARCHTPIAWIVNNITEIHQKSRFPLVGPHVTADCFDCHINASASLLNFGPLGVECFDCHQANYTATTNPNHTASGYSTNCTECHNMNSFSWTGAGINHNFFPLTAGHDINDCNQCHPGGNYSSTSPDCVSCHQANYNATSNPNHIASNFPTTCLDCHTTNPGWKPAEFRNHDVKFPIYSGKHNGEWSSCADCHTNPASYAQFTCIDCHDHNQPDMNSKHSDVAGYIYNSIACFECHPTGSSEGAFNHNTSIFPLTGAHATVECIKCHTNGYGGTSTVCYDCHTSNYNQSTNPNHITSQFPATCETCHSQSAWSPSIFNHNNVYPLTGAHATIASDCFACHQGNYINTPNTCAGCHQANYNQTTNPNHGAISIPTECATCHTTNPNWTPANFPIHNNYYVLAGAHVAIANQCVVCHNGNYNSTPNTCVGCHLNDYNQTNDPPHAASQFPTTCLDCHTQSAWTPANWNHDGLYFPIYSGKHNGKWNTCSDCHTNPGNYAVFSCITSCHSQSSTNNDHQGVAGYSYNSNACYNCHPNGSAPKMLERNNFNKN